MQTDGPDARIGQTVSRYRVDSLLGEGGMGKVYIGIHEVLESKAAIKFLRSDLSKDSEIVERFINEAKAATKINHAGIIKVYDFGYHQGSAFCVMEFLEGESLSDRLTRVGALSSQEIARIGSQMADALGAAHAAGIVHRDLKPDNVFLVPDRQVPGGERVKILDFGIAKLASAELKASFKTRPGMMMGTPHYMSPEQIRGAGDVDGRADIYSLGCMLFQMACGQVPFGGESLGSILGAHEHVAPPSPRTLNPNVPPPAESFILKTLAKAPTDRPQTMQEVTTGLSAFGRTSLEMASEATHPTTLSHSTGQQFQRPDTPLSVIEPKKSPVPLIVGSVLAFAAAATIGFFVWKSTKGDNESAGGETGTESKAVTPAPSIDAAPAPGSETETEAKIVADKTEVEPVRVEPADPTPFPHRWVRITPPTKRVLLGVGKDAKQPGFRPDKKIMSPRIPFEIQQHEVTWKEFGPWLENNKAKHSVHTPSWLPSNSAGRDLFPVTGVSWTTADAYCRSLGDSARLPSDEQWELAARGAKMRAYSWGDDTPDPKRTRVYAGAKAPLVAVMTMDQDETEPTALEPAPVFDMTGNAFEWVDGYGRDDAAADDSWAHTGAMKFRAYRGMPAGAAMPKAMPAVGAAYRGILCESGTCDAKATAIVEYLGFRCVRDAEAPAK